MKRNQNYRQLIDWYNRGIINRRTFVYWWAKAKAWEAV